MNRFLALFFILHLGIAYAGVRLTPLENFDSGTVALSSWAAEDQSPNSWSLVSSTPDGSPFCLKLYGNTWKYQGISPHQVDSIGVIQVRAKTEANGKVQGIGFSDGVHQLFYSFSGTTILNLESWIPVYQGAMSNNVWNTYRLPLASDWQAFYEYIPTITGIIYVNDMDGVSVRTVFFDAIEDISADLPHSPIPSISYSSPAFAKEVGFNFACTVVDEDSQEFSYLWDFGDSNTSTIANPFHMYNCTDAHSYRVTLRVTDESGRKGYASAVVQVDPGPSTMPVTMNFVGDIMLARDYEQGGGIIPTYGVNSIFAPTKPMFGDVADISVANLEVVLANVGSPHPTKSVVYRGNPQNIAGLLYAGIDCVSTANNHVMDYGEPALLQMQNMLNSSGIVYSGSGSDSYLAYQPAFINKRGLNIAFLRCSDRTGQYNNAQPFLQAGYNKPGFAYMTPYYIQQQLDAVEGLADLKIVEMHGGSEYSTSPGAGYDKGNPFLEDTKDEDYSNRSDIPHQWDIDIRHSAVDSGADLVIVHHPHIIQGLEVYNNKLIAHSLGNFAFDLDYPETMPSMILYADAYPDGFRNYRIKPVYIDGYIPKPATGELGMYILDYVAMRSRDLNTRLWVDRNAMEAKVLMQDDEPSVCVSDSRITVPVDDYSATNNQTAPINLPRMGSISQVNAIDPQGNYQIRLGKECIWFGNFEDEGSGLWDIPAYSTTDVFDGVRSAILTVSDNQSITSTISKRSKIYDNTQKFTLHGWIKTLNSNGANITIRFYNTRNGSVIASETICPGIEGSTEWTFYYKELSIPPSAYYYDIRLSNTVLSRTSHALFDNVGLIEWSAWTSIGELQDIPWPNNYYWMQVQSSDDMKSVSVFLTEKAYSANVGNQLSSNTAPSPEIDLYPNPFNPDTTISCYLPQDAEIDVGIYNIRGQLVKKLARGNYQQGKHRFIWDSRDSSNRQVASGMYFVRVSTGAACSVKKMVLLK